jgi:ribosomal protein S11
VSFDQPSDIALAADGDLFVADARNNRICRIESPSGRIITIAGSGAASYDGDNRQATQTALNAPSTVAVARNGDLYFTDTNNHRVRVVVQATGLIRTVAGDGTIGRPDMIGDGGPATAAHLDKPGGLAIAPGGDLYIADTGHHRVRRVDVATGLITTVAGDGFPGFAGDEGPATRARLSAPLGLALASVGRGLAIYIADSENGRVRVVRPNRTITTVGGAARFTMPTRVAYHSGGWLYVKDSSLVGVTLVPAARVRLDLVATPQPRPTPGKV